MISFAWKSISELADLASLRKVMKSYQIKVQIPYKRLYSLNRVSPNHTNATLQTFLFLEASFIQFLFNQIVPILPRITSWEVSYQMVDTVILNDILDPRALSSEREELWRREWINTEQHSDLFKILLGTNSVAEEPDSNPLSTLNSLQSRLGTRLLKTKQTNHARL